MTATTRNTAILVSGPAGAAGSPDGGQLGLFWLWQKNRHPYVYRQVATPQQRPPARGTVRSFDVFVPPPPAAAPSASDWYELEKTPLQTAPYRGKAAAFDLQLPIAVAPGASDWYEQHRVRTIKPADQGRAAAAFVEPYWTPIDRADWYEHAALRNQRPAYAGRAASQFEAQPFPVFPYFYGTATPRQDAPYRGAAKIFYADTAPAAAFQDFAWLFDAALPQPRPAYRGNVLQFYADFAPAAPAFQDYAWFDGTGSRLPMPVVQKGQVVAFYIDQEWPSVPPAPSGAGREYKRKLPRYIIREIERAEDKVDAALVETKPETKKSAAIAKAERAIKKLELFAETLANPEPVFAALDEMRKQIDAYRSGLVYARHRRLLLEDDEWLMMN